MNFTREPIIETVITPKDGYKLTIRNSKGGSQEEYSVDAIEVVSFGQSMFFRSQERPKSFLLPVTDYEVVEVKETRVVLKNAPLEGSIKIAGGKVAKQAPVHPKDQEEKPQVAQKQEENFEERPSRRRKSSLRRRRAEHDNHDAHPKVQSEIKPPKLVNLTSSVELEKKEEPQVDQTNLQLEAPISTAMFKGLIPPPPGLISEKLQHEKYSPYLKENLKDEKGVSTSVEHDEKNEETDVNYEIIIDEALEETTPSDVFVDEEVEKVDVLKEPRYHAAPRNDQGEILF